jgi:hypothetical protein
MESTIPESRRRWTIGRKDSMGKHRGMNEPTKLRPFLVREERPPLSDEERKQQVSDICLTAEFRLLRYERDRERLKKAA